MKKDFRTILSTAVLAAVLPGCSGIPTSGPTTKSIVSAGPQQKMDGIQIVDVNSDVARQLLAERQRRMFSDVFGSARANTRRVGMGDALEVSIWEAPPATLFGPGTLDTHGAPSVSRVTTLPDQVVDNDGFITVPFAGNIRAAGETIPQIETEIRRRLFGKANQPQVIVRLMQNVSANVTVVGEVNKSTRMPLTPRGERLLDALAAAGGTREPVNKITVQLTRGNRVSDMPLETVIKDPHQDVPLQPGDVITALYQPLSFTALGATGKNEEINFEAQGITLAQAMARSGGLNDNRSDAQGVFIFRFEPANALKWPNQPVLTTPDGKVPVIYRFDLKDPGSFFVAQSFQMKNKDLLYVSNAPVAELQKFLNVVFSVAYPVISATQTFRHP